MASHHSSITAHCVGKIMLQDLPPTLVADEIIFAECVDDLIGLDADLSLRCSIRGLGYELATASTLECHSGQVNQ
jgi:hypothetical protein